MDDAPYIGDLDLGEVKTRADLAALLRIVHIRADKPSLRTLEARTRHSPTPLSKTVVAEMLNGVRFPRKAVMVAFLLACGVEGDDVEPWRRTWERVASGEGTTARPRMVQTAPSPLVGRHPPQLSDEPGDGAHTKRVRGGGTTAGKTTTPSDLAGIKQLRDQVKRLNSDNDRLRARLAATRRQAAEQLPPDEAASRQRPRSPTVSRRELGALLRDLRTAKGMTVEQVAEHLLCKPAKVKRMEGSFRAGTIRDVRDLCDLYAVTETTQRDHLMELAHEVKQQGWWQPYDLPYAEYIGLETDATSSMNFNSSVVPGILQTPAYARELHYKAVPRLSPELIEQRLETRLIRQRRLSETNPLRVWSILDEAVLHRVIGGPSAMRIQLEHLMELTRLPNIAIQVVPFQAGAHPALESIFTILEFAANIDNVVYVEGLIGRYLFDQPEDVKHYRTIFNTLSEMALSQEDSIELIANVSKQIGPPFTI
jgi:transcriptional regulator with XRE-family HTH domain